MTTALQRPSFGSTPSVDLGTLIGARGPTIAWSRVWLLVVAGFAGRLVWVAWTLIQARSLATPTYWLGIALSAGLFAAVLVVALRRIANNYAAVAAASVTYALLQTGLRLVTQTIPPDVPDYWLFAVRAATGNAVSTFASTATLAFALRAMQPLWLALAGGAVIGELVAAFASTLAYAAMSPGFHLSFEFSSLGLGLLDGLVFAGVILAGLHSRWVAAPEAGAAQAYEAGAGVQRMPKGIYVGVPAVCFGLAIPMIIIANVLARSEPGVAAPLALAAMLPVAVGGVAMVFFVHRMWASIQDGHARTTPGRAVGLLFVPFFNIYWAFQVLPGFATDYNRLLERRGLRLAPLPPGLFAAYIGLSFGAVIPGFGLVLIAANYFVALAMLSRTCEAVNALPSIEPPATAVRAEAAAG
jgi:hypothetical protein